MQVDPATITDVLLSDGMWHQPDVGSVKAGGLSFWTDDGTAGTPTPAGGALEWRVSGTQVVVPLAAIFGLKTSAPLP